MGTFIELCAGAGGLSTGLIKAGLTPLLLNDIDKNCYETLRINHPNCNIVKGSMESLDFTEYIGKCDVIVGGVPCQSFSQAGSRRGLDDPRGTLMQSFANIVHTVKPKLFMIENVKGLLSHNNGITITTIIDMLKGTDYMVVYKVLNASKYNVPQKRERVFIIGVRIKDQPLNNCINIFQFPKESSNTVLLKDVLNDVPESPCAKYNENKIRLFEMIPQGGCWVNLPNNLQIEYLGNSYYSGGGKRGILYRLSMNSFAPTLLCSPSQKQTERCHPLYNRPLSIREYARIQTFDDDYVFSGNIVSQYRQIGNAVPVQLAYAMGISITFYLSELNNDASS